MSKITLFAQVIGKLDSGKFKKLVAKHQADKHQKGFSSRTHLVLMGTCLHASTLPMAGLPTTKGLMTYPCTRAA